MRIITTGDAPFTAVITTTNSKDTVFAEGESYEECYEYALTELQVLINALINLGEKVVES